MPQPSHSVVSGLLSWRDNEVSYGSGVLIIAHRAKSFEHIFLHVRTGVIPGGEERTNHWIQFFGQDSGYNGQCLRTVIGFALIARRDVVFSVPERTVELFTQLVGGGACPGGFFCLTPPTGSFLRIPSGQSHTKG